MKRVLDSGFAWVQNATFFKKLRFGLNQTQNIASFFIYALFGLQKAQTNAHLMVNTTIHESKSSFLRNKGIVGIKINVFKVFFNK